MTRHSLRLNADLFLSNKHSQPKNPNKNYYDSCWDDVIGADHHIIFFFFVSLLIPPFSIYSTRMKYVVWCKKINKINWKTETNRTTEQRTPGFCICINTRKKNSVGRTTFWSCYVSIVSLFRLRRLHRLRQLHSRPTIPNVRRCVCVWARVCFRFSFLLPSDS